MRLRLSGAQGRAAARSGAVSRDLIAAALAVGICVLVVIVALQLLPRGSDERPAGSEKDVVSDPGSADAGTPGEATSPSGGPSPATAGTTGSGGEPAVASDEPAPSQKPGAWVVGTVRVHKTTDPAPGVQVVLRRDVPEVESQEIGVRLQPPKLRETDFHGLTAEDGTYRVEGLPDGGYRVFVLSHETEFVTISPTQGRTVTVSQERSPCTVDIAVNRGGTIRGKVFDGEGEPIAKAKILSQDRDFLSAVFDPDRDSVAFGETQTDEDGRYEISGLPLDRTYLLRATAEGRALAVSEPVSFDEEVLIVVLDIELLTGANARGVVLDGNEFAKPETTVQLASADSGGFPFSMAPLSQSETDAEGRFAFEHLAAGKYRVVVAAATRISTQSGPSSVEFECDGETDVVDLVIRVPVESESTDDGVVRGTVRDDLGVPLEGAQLGLVGFVPESGAFQAEAISGKDGTFELRDVPRRGAFTLTANAEGHSTYVRSGIAPGEDNLEVVLGRVSRIRGVVISAASGEPVGGAVVRGVPLGEGLESMARLMAGQLGGGAPSVQAAEDGSFSLDGLPAGRLRLRAEAVGFGPGYSGELQLDPGVEVSEVEIALTEGGGIRGVVVAPDGTPVVDAVVRMTEESGAGWESWMRKAMPGMVGQDSSATVKTLGDGTFELSHLPAGKLSLTATHPDFAPSAELHLALASDELREGVSLRLCRPGGVRVVVKEKTKPVTGLMVQVLSNGPMKMTTTDADGKAEVGGLAPGEYLVQVLDLAQMATLGRLRQRVATIQEGGIAEIEIVFGEGAKVTGKVEGTLPGPMNLVTLRRPGGPAPEDQDPNDIAASFSAAKYTVGTALVKPDGTYTIEDVPDGEFIIEIPRMPNSLGPAATMPAERGPLYRDTIEVQSGRDVKKEIRLKSTVDR